MSKEGDDGLRSSKEIVHNRVSAECRFDNILKEIKVLSGGDGNIVCEMLVKPEYRNSHGTLHGGMMATLVDSVTTFALHTRLPDKNSISVDLHLSFMRTAKVGETIRIDAKTVKCGRRVAFITADIRTADGEVCAQGQHTKMLIDKPKM